MEKTQSHICTHCQGEVVFFVMRLQASYGWMSCPHCGKVSHFEPKFGSQHQAVSFYLRSKKVRLEGQPSNFSRLHPLGLEHSVSPVAQSSTLSMEMLLEAKDQTATNEEWSKSASGEVIVAAGSSKVQRSARSWLWIGTAGLFSLCVAIGGWNIFFQRDWLGARWPQTVPWLERFCVVLDCQVRPYQSLREIDIQSSSLQWLQYDGSDYQLEFVLANRSKEMTVATPLVHLVLLDLKGDVLLRQKLEQKDLPDFPAVLAPQAQWVAQTKIQLDLPAVEIDPKRILFELTLAYE